MERNDSVRKERIIWYIEDGQLVPVVQKIWLNLPHSRSLDYVFGYAANRHKNAGQGQKNSALNRARSMKTTDGRPAKLQGSLHQPSTWLPSEFPIWRTARDNLSAQRL